MRLFLTLLTLIAAPAVADVTFVGATTSLSASATSRTPEEPNGVQQGDLLFGVCSTVTTNDGSWSVPSGFNRITEVLDDAGTDRDVVLAYGIRGSSAGTYTFSYDGSAGAVRCALAAFRGVDTSTPFDVEYSAEDHHSDLQDAPNDAAKPITTATDGAWVVLVQVRAGDVADTTAAPSGYIEWVDYFGSSPEISIVAKAIASAGEETPGSWGHTGTTFAEASNFTLALRPATVPASFSSGPSIAPAMYGYTVSGTMLGDGTLTAYAVACLPALEDASAAQVKAGNCANDAAAEIAASEVWSSGVADSFSLTKSSAYPLNKVCVVGSDGANDTDVTCSTLLRSADPGQTIVILE